ncbi:MAG TPA: hypothetical protein VN461_04805 [Vicinamibacteria bacterium]|nr:hypothetical protein [Vicinamibacteria bacterium]
MSFTTLSLLYLALLGLPLWLSWDPLAPYFAAVFLLALGVSIATKKAPPHANALDKIILCGPVFIAMPMAVFGIDHYLDPIGVGRIIPAWIPAHAFWVYLVGTCLILGGLSIVVQKNAGLSAGLFGVMLLCFEILMHVPSVVAAPLNHLRWALALRDLSFSCGALAFAATHPQDWWTRGAHRLISPARMVIGIVLTFFAAEYLLHPAFLPGVPGGELTPNLVPGHSVWGYLTGLVYLVAGICLLINKAARLAATWSGLFVLLAAILFCVPFLVQQGFDVGSGLNVPVDNLLFSGALLCLAGSQRDTPAMRT